MADGGPFSGRYGLGTDLLARPPPGLSPRRLRRSRRARQNAAVVCLLVIALAERLDRVAVGGDRQNVLSAACGGIHVAGSGPGPVCCRRVTVRDLAPSVLAAHGPFTSVLYLFGARRSTRTCVRVNPATANSCTSRRRNPKGPGAGLRVGRDHQVDLGSRCNSVGPSPHQGWSRPWCKHSRCGSPLGSPRGCSCP